jgi:hypothetical protein
MGEIGSGGGSSYPTALDTNNTPEVNSPNAAKTKARAEVPNDLAGAVVAIETELGTDPAGTLTDVKTYLQTEHSTDGTHGDITTDSIVNSGTLTSNGIIKWAKGADIASASALPLGVDGDYFDVTGTTTITSISSVGIGNVIKLHFDGAVTLTHHATDLVLPGGADITTAAGDEIEFIEYASGDWRLTNYIPYLPTLKTKIIDIGDWDMDATATVNIAHGLTMTNIRVMEAFIQSDGSAGVYPLNRVLNPTTPTLQGSVSVADSTNITLHRTTGGIFDSINFDATSFNRGWITIIYIA